MRSVSPRPTLTSPRAGFAVGAAAFVAWAFAVAIWTAADVTIPWDAKAQFYNFFRFVGLAFAQGELPLWNPYHFSGFPSVADPQSLLFSPGFALAAFLRPNMTIGGYDAVVFAHLAVGAAAAGLLASRLGYGAAAAILVVMIVFFAGPAMGRLQHVGQILSYSWLAVSLLALDRALERPSIGRALVFSLPAAAMTLGRDQIAYLGVLTLLAYALYDGLSAPRFAAWLRERILAFALMGVAIAALVVAPILLTLQFASVSNRPAVPYEVAALGSLHPLTLIGMAAGDFFGALRPGEAYWGAGTPTWPMFDHTDRSINFLHLGAVPLALIAWALAARRLEWPRGTIFFGSLALFALLYALGRHTPLFPLLHAWLPGVAIYRRPADAAFLLILALAFVAGGALEALSRGGFPRPNGFIVAVGVVALAAIGAAALTLAPTAEAMRIAGASTVRLCTFLAIAGAAMFFLRRSHAFAMSLVAIATLDFVSLGPTSIINSEPKAVYAPLRDAPSPDRAALTALSTLLAADHAAGRRPRAEILGPEAGWQNVAMAIGVETTLGYNPLRVALYERFTGAAEVSHEPRLRPYPPTFRGYRSLLARLLGVEYLVLDLPLDRMPRELPRGRLQTVHEGPPIWIHRLPNAAPRAYLAARVTRSDPEAAFKADEIPEFDLGTEALVDPDAPISEGLVSDGTPARPAPGRVAIADYRLNQVRLVAETEAPVLLVLHDLAYPGWTVSVNGEARPLLRANILFRGVELQPGRHEIVFRYQPFSPANLMTAARGALGGRKAQP